MRYSVVAIGRLTRGFYKGGSDHYLKRLGGYAKVEMVELKDSRLNDAAARDDEAKRLLAAASGYLIALDEQGEGQDSRTLAARVTALETQGVSRISLLIGGAQGHGQRLRERAQAAWSLSSLTLPHELARLVLLEQLYRIETIRAGHPYHRD
ncbi:23S rRNA (pseudouridine(1915)-N(3))-methyltransferase RlmH [soil metagenome]